MKKLLSLAALLGTVTACGAGDDYNFNVNTAPSFKRDGNSISVFGVFRDGRMNPETWEDLAPKFSGVLHNPACASAISMGLRSSSSPIFQAVDDVARSDGITDLLLQKFEPAAQGDTILVIIVDGKTSKPKDEPVGNTTTTQMGMGGGGMGRGRGMPSRQPSRKEAEKSIFEMTATLYSKRQHQSVALVSMAYNGPSEDEAVQKFIARLGATFPSATCAGWSADLTTLDADAIRSAR